MERRRPSTASTFDVVRTDAAALLGIAETFAERGLCGLVWCNAALVVRRVVGTLTQGISIGAPLGEAIPALMGLEGDIGLLRGQRDGHLTLPSVSMVTRAGSGPRLDLTVIWHGRQRAFVVLLSRAAIRPDLQMELAREVRGRLMAEAEVRARSAELARANRDLEAFAAIVSHDLTAPLRAMRYHMDDLEAALGERSVGVAVPLDEIRAQSRRMSQMLSALLEYSRVGYKREAVERVETYTYADAAVRAAASEARPGIRVVVEGHWPILDTLPAPFDLVLRNLVQNAVAHHDREAGLVRIVAAVREPWLTVEVADDGPGIPLAHQAAVFLPFRALGETPKADRTGMGLALVQRTIETVGARIALVSDPDRARGTTFRIDWPLVIRT